ncbi:MAG: hypothetical protein M3Z25_02920 [Actinomycetota bacterium]|nr:hypothetical protein [Actinomycetota bacterium]
MLVKAGIVVSAAAATLLAVSPLAFAGDYSDDGGHSHHKSHDKERNRGHRGSGDCNQETNQSNGGDSSGLINVSHINAAVPIAACDNDILSGVLGVLSSGLSNKSNH